MLDQNEILLQHLNNQIPHIKFTYEKENLFSLPFLDMLILIENRMDPFRSVCIKKQPIQEDN